MKSTYWRDISFPSDKPITFDNVMGIVVPSGTTAQRPTTPMNGTFRYNVNIGAVEVFQGGVWEVISVTSVTGEANTASNVGGGIPLFKGKIGIDLEFRTLEAGENILLSYDANTVKIDSVGGSDIIGSNIGAGTGSVFLNKNGSELRFRTLNSVSPYISISNNGNTIDVNTSLTPAEIITGANIGSGLGVFSVKTGSQLRFKSIAVASPLSITDNTDTLEISLMNNPVLPGSGAVIVPIGTTLQRPGTPSIGMLRYNSQTTDLEFYNGVWTALSNSGGVQKAGDTMTGSLTMGAGANIILNQGNLTLTNGNIAVSGTVDGRDLSADGAVIDAISGVSDGFVAKAGGSLVNRTISGSSGVTVTNGDGSGATSIGLDMNFISHNIVLPDLVLPTIADLRSLDSSLDKHASIKCVNVLGFLSENDGGGSQFITDTSDTTTLDGEFDNNGRFTIVDAAGLRYKMLVQGPLNVACIGVRTDISTTNYLLIEAALNNYGDVYIPEGMMLRISFDPINITKKGARLRGGILQKNTNTPFAIHIQADDVIIENVQFVALLSSGQPEGEIKIGSGCRNVKIKDCKFGMHTSEVSGGGTDDSKRTRIYSAICSADNPRPFLETVDDTTDELTFSDDMPSTGFAIKFAKQKDTDTLPAPLTFDTTYYLISTATATIRKLAASASDATDGIAINITENTIGGRPFTVSADSDFTTYERINGLEISGCTFYGYTLQLYLFFIENFRIVNNHFEESRFDSIRIREAIGWGTITGNTFYRCGTWDGDARSRDCIDTAWSGNRLTIQGNVFRECKGPAAIDMKGGSASSHVDGFLTREILIMGNIFDRGYRGAIAFGSGTESSPDSSVCHNLTVIGNTFNKFCLANESNTATDDADIPVVIIIKGVANGIDISHNNFTSNHGTTIYLEPGVRNTTIAYNKIYNGYRKVIRLRKPHGLQLVGNIIESVTWADNPGVMEWGIVVDEVALDVYHDNVCRDNRIIGMNSAPYIVNTPNENMTPWFVWSGNYESGPNAYGGTVGDGSPWRRSRRILHGRGNRPSSGEGRALRGDLILNTEVELGGRMGVVAIENGSGTNRWVSFGQAGHREGTTSPISTITPLFTGEEYFDNVAKQWYKSVGLTTADWKLMTS